MASYNSDLKVWGDAGIEYPTGYSYAKDERPVDGWDNNFNYHASVDIQHLIELTNERLETGSGVGYPSAPESGHLSWRSDNQRLAVYDVGAGDWREFAYRSEFDVLRSEYDAHEASGNPHSDSASESYVNSRTDTEVTSHETNGSHSQLSGGVVDRTQPITSLSGNVYVTPLGASDPTENDGDIWLQYE